ncbi:unnamed protein product [Prorocentrum cordatum]|uniref:Protein kinase domain-containing protein n=1 Tax=Prorocentrum cordatum TaxID=2364126 RepID=A0ABN9RUJ4_9DINO|nr:unnamed protein product [Polarella glacialis]
MLRLDRGWPPSDQKNNFRRLMGVRTPFCLGCVLFCVLMELECDPQALLHKVRLELKESSVVQQRLRAFEAESSRGIPSASDCEAIEDEIDGLLWESIPNLLFPGFAPLDKRLLESGVWVGDCRLVHSYATHKRVLLAVNGQHENVVIKVHNKRSVTDATQVECIYKEFCFLKHTLHHPHIIRCESMLHSRCNVHLVLQHGGDVCMEQVLSTRPGQRLSRDDAFECSAQVASALSYCHALDVVHGQVSLRHVTVEMACSRHICRLVDFSMAAHVPDSSTRETYCSSLRSLPCVAPETALEEPYLPKPADCWSLGVVFLEIACGQGSLELSVQWRREEPLARAAWQILEFFARAGCHTEAMTKMGNVHDGTASVCLQAVLTPEPARRASAADMVGLLAMGHVEVESDSAVRV